MKIDITSDVTCPFCLIGVKQLLSAVAQHKTTHPSSLDFQIRLLPYQLNPNASTSPISKTEALTAKFGAQRTQQILSALPMKYASVGCTPNFTDGLTSSTHVAHRLQTYALLHHPTAQLPLSLDIFDGHQCGPHHPSDIPWLAQLAVKHGVFPSEGEAKEWLEGNECDTEVRKAYVAAQQMGVTGVPFFVFDDKWAASGAMGTEEFVKLLEDITKRSEANSPKTNGKEGNGDSCVLGEGGEACN
ncbi:hypothetical protein IAT38_001606 [Cryptococcus sp. DSM 104549]